MSKNRTALPSITIGAKHDRPVPSRNGVKLLHPWQQAALVDVADAVRVFVSSPTGSGKSLLMKLLAARWLQAGYSVVIAVPQLCLIDQWLAPDAAYISDDATMPEFYTGATRGTVAGLRRELVRERGAGARVLVVTHDALRAAGRGRSSFPGCALMVDEAHSVNGSDYETKLDEDGNAAEYGPNVIGNVVRAALQSDARVLLATATPWRQVGTLLTQAEQQRFVWVERSPIDHIADLGVVCHLRVLRTQTPEQALRTLCRPKTASRFVWLPRVQAGAARSVKIGYRDVAIAAASYTSDVVDLVDDSDADLRQERLCQLRARADINAMPGLIVSQNIGHTGLDLPGLTSAVAPATQSPALMIQQLGRLFRKSPDKDEIEFTVYAWGEDGDTKPLEVLLASIVTILALGTECRLPPAVRSRTFTEARDEVEGIVRDSLAGREPSVQSPRGQALAQVLGIDLDGVDMSALGIVVMDSVQGYASASCTVDAGTLREVVRSQEAHIRLSAAEREVVITMYRQGATLNQIARAVGCTVTTVALRLEDAGERAREKRGGAGDLRAALESVHGGVMVSAAAKLHRVSARRLSAACRVAGVAVATKPTRAGMAERLEQAVRAVLLGTKPRSASELHRVSARRLSAACRAAGIAVAAQGGRKAGNMDGATAFVLSGQGSAWAAEKQFNVDGKRLAARLRELGYELRGRGRPARWVKVDPTQAAS